MDIVIKNKTYAFACHLKIVFCAIYGLFLACFVHLMVANVCICMSVYNHTVNI